MQCSEGMAEPWKTRHRLFGLLATPCLSHLQPAAFWRLEQHFAYCLLHQCRYSQKSLLSDACWPLEAISPQAAPIPILAGWGTERRRSRRSALLQIRRRHRRMRTCALPLYASAALRETARPRPLRVPPCEPGTSAGPAARSISSRGISSPPRSAKLFLPDSSM